MTLVTRGNFFKKTFNLSDDVTVTGGNFIGCDVVLNGFSLTLNAGANYRGILVDGVKLVQGSPPPGVTLGPGVVVPATYTRFTYHPKALAVIRGLFEVGGDVAVDIWQKALDEIFADNAISYPSLLSAVEAWASADPGGNLGVRNFADINKLFLRIQAQAFGGASYNAVKTELLGQTRGTWEGNPEVVEEVL